MARAAQWMEAHNLDVGTVCQGIAWIVINVAFVVWIIALASAV
ncbi:MAG TPA: hypothetical protein VF115_04290 [Acidimicrobiia bacterium]